MSRRMNASTQNNKKVQRTLLSQITICPRAKEMVSSDYQDMSALFTERFGRDLIQSPAQGVATPPCSVRYGWENCARTRQIKSSYWHNLLGLRLTQKKMFMTVYLHIAEVYLTRCAKCSGDYYTMLFSFILQSWCKQKCITSIPCSLCLKYSGEGWRKNCSWTTAQWTEYSPA